MAEKYRKDMTPEEKAARKQQRMDELQTQREAGALQRSLARAASSPEYNFTQRPEGFIDQGNNVIRYYGWTGGKETGKWVAREAPLTEVNYNKYKNLIPAAEFAVKDIKSKMIATKPGTEGFVVKGDKIETKGIVDKSILGVKSDLDVEKILGKRTERDAAALSAALERAQKSPLTNFMKENMEKYVTKINEQQYFQPTSIQDTLVPVLTMYGGTWENALKRRKVVTKFDPTNVAVISLTGQPNYLNRSNYIKP